MSIISPINSEALQGVILERAGEYFVSFSRADFLGLSQDKKVIHSIQAAMETEAVVLTGSPRQGGLRPIHSLVEARFSAFKNSEDSILLASYQTAYREACRILSEKNSYALVPESFPERIVEIIEGAGLEVETFSCLEPDSLSALFSNRKELLGSPVFLEGLSYSMGDVPPVAAFLKVCATSKSVLVVDESCAMGVLGILGSGAIEKAGLSGKGIVSITALDRAIGLPGVIVSGDKTLTTSLRTFLQDENLPPLPFVFGLDKALELIEVEVRKRSRLRTHALCLREGLRSMGFSLEGDPISPIVRIDTGDESLNCELSKGLVERGILVDYNPDGSLRALVSALHRDEHIADFLQSISDVAKRIGAL